MPADKISGVACSGTIIARQTTVNAAKALNLLRTARQQHSWTRLNDEEGNDVSENELKRRAACCGSESGPQCARHVGFVRSVSRGRKARSGAPAQGGSRSLVRPED
jgi:hypothetical protein